MIKRYSERLLAVCSAVLIVGWGAPARADGEVEGEAAREVLEASGEPLRGTTGVEVGEALREARALVARASDDGVFEDRKILRFELRCRLVEGRREGAQREIGELELCRDPLAVERLKDLTGLYVGQTYSGFRLRLAQERLLKTGFFAGISVQRSASPSGVEVTIVADGATIIREIRFAGLEPPPFAEDLRKVLLYREGQPYTDDLDKKKAQIRSLEDVYAREGYIGTQLEMVAVRDKDNAAIVDLTFRITKQPERPICDVGVRGLRTMSYPEARRLILSGLPVWERLLGNIRMPAALDGLSPHHNERAFKAGQEALVKEYRARGYFQARVLGKQVRRFDDEGRLVLSSEDRLTMTGDPDAVRERVRGEPGCVELVVDVSEGPRWELVFEGNERFDAELLRAGLPFETTGYVDAYVIERAAAQVQKYYATRGYPFTKVTGREVRKDRLDRQIIFTIEEGDLLEIRRIEFFREGGVVEGEPTDEELLALMQTRAFELFAAGGYLQYDELLGDILRIEDQYRVRGFARAVVSGFAVERMPEDDGLKIVLTIMPGVRQRVGSVRLVGASRVGEGVLRREIKEQPGLAFVPIEARADTSRLIQYYAEQGYPLAEVQTLCVAAGAEPEVEAAQGERWRAGSRRLEEAAKACELPRLPEGCVARTQEQIERACIWASGSRPRRECRRLSAEPACVFTGGVLAGDVSLIHRISEGPLVRVGEILLKGNFETDTALIYGEVPLKRGDLFNVKKLLEGQANLRSLGLFDSVSVEAIGLDEGARRSEEAVAAVLISVEEGDYQALDFRFGFQGRDLLDSEVRRLLLLGEAQYTNRNLLGLGQRFSPRLMGALDMLQIVQSTTDSGISIGERFGQMDYLFGAELTFSDPRFLRDAAGFERLTVTVAPYYLLDLLGVTSNRLLREEAGVRGEVRKELTEVLSRLFVTLGLQGKIISTWSDTSGSPVIDGERLFSPRRTIGKLYLDTALDRRDSPLNPRKGFLLQFRPQWVSGDALQGTAGDALRTSFMRLTLNTSVFIPLGSKVVLAQGLRYGHIVPVLERPQPVTEDERYLLGGVGSLRGLPESGLLSTYNPNSPAPQLLGGEFVLNYSAELRYPLLASLGLSGAMFTDAGVLADCFSEETGERVGCWRDAFPSGSPLSTVRASVGVGLRYLVLDQIPLLLDYAVLLNRRPGEAFSNVHFNIGYSF